MPSNWRARSTPSTGTTSRSIASPAVPREVHRGHVRRGPEAAVARIHTPRSRVRADRPRAAVRCRGAFYRPGIVVGTAHRRDGPRSDSPTTIFKAIQARAPAASSGRTLIAARHPRQNTNVVPVDWVVDADEHIAARARPRWGRRIISPTAPQRVDEMIKRASPRPAHAPRMRFSRRQTPGPRPAAKWPLTLRRPPAWRQLRRSRCAKLWTEEVLAQMELRPRSMRDEGGSARHGTPLAAAALHDYASAGGLRERDMEPSRSRGARLREGASTEARVNTGARRGSGDRPR